MLGLLGGALALGGIAGAYASGSMDRGRLVDAPQVDKNAYQWGGKRGAAEEERARLQGLEMGGRQDAAMARGLQGEAAGMYRDMASGKGPSAGQAILSQGMQRAGQDAANLAVSARGGGGAQQAAMRRAQEAQASGMATAANNAAILRAQEQQAGIAGLAASGQAMRAADVASYQGDQAAGMQVAGQQLQANMAADEARQRNEMWEAQTRLGQENAARERKAKLWGGMTSAGAGLMGAGLA